MQSSSSRETSSGGAPWAQTTNVTFQKNVVMNSPNGINIGATDITGYPAIAASNFNINNNLLYNIGDSSGGTLFQLAGTTTRGVIERLNYEQYGDPASHGGDKRRSDFVHWTPDDRLCLQQ